MDNEALIETNLTVELKLLHADGTEELIGEYPVYQAAEASEPDSEEAPGE
jgi:hypothetical protein